MEIVLRQSQFLKTSLKPVFENLPKPHLILSTVLISLYLFHPLNFLEIQQSSDLFYAVGSPF
jgi:hypothetical protein